MGTDRDVLFLSLDATEVTDLYGVSFDLVFPVDLLQFEALTEGSFLDEAATVTTSLQMVEDMSGNLVIGLTRLGDVGGVEGSGPLLLLEFSRVAAGEGTMEFMSNNALDSSGAVAEGLTWAGGTVSVPE